MADRRKIPQEPAVPLSKTRTGFCSETKKSQFVEKFYEISRMASGKGADACAPPCGLSRLIPADLTVAKMRQGFVSCGVRDTHKRGRPVEASVFVFSLSKSAERVGCDVPLEQPRRNIVNIGPKSREIPTERREANIKILVGREVPMED